MPQRVASADSTKAPAAPELSRVNLKTEPGVAARGVVQTPQTALSPQSTRLHVPRGVVSLGTSSGVVMGRPAHLRSEDVKRADHRQSQARPEPPSRRAAFAGLASSGAGRMGSAAALVPLTGPSDRSGRRA